MTRVDDPGPRLSGRAGIDPDLVPFAVSDGTVLAIDDHGPRDGAAATVVLVPGWTQDHTSWEDVVAELGRIAPQLRVITPEARGHGRSDAGPRGTYTIDQLADDLADVLTGYLPDGPVVLAGHSLGGPIVMSFAERHPDLVRDRVVGLALVATSAAGLGRDVFGLSGRLTAPALFVEPLVARVRSWSRAKVNLRHPALLAPFIRWGFYGPGADTKHNRERTAGQVARAHPATTAALVDEMAHHDRSHMLAELDSTPTLVMVGTKDGLCPIAHSRVIAEAMPNAELVIYPGAGHMLPFERPTELAEQLVGLADAATQCRSTKAE